MIVSFASLHIRKEKTNWICIVHVATWQSRSDLRQSGYIYGDVGVPPEPHTYLYVKDQSMFVQLIKYWLGWAS